MDNFQMKVERCSKIIWLLSFGAVFRLEFWILLIFSETVHWILFISVFIKWNKRISFKWKSVFQNNWLLSFGVLSRIEFWILRIFSETVHWISFISDFKMEQMDIFEMKAERCTKIICLMSFGAVSRLQFWILQIWILQIFSEKVHWISFISDI